MVKRRWGLGGAREKTASQWPLVLRLDLNLVESIPYLGFRWQAVWFGRFS